MLRKSVYLKSRRDVSLEKVPETYCFRFPFMIKKIDYRQIKVNLGDANWWTHKTRNEYGKNDCQLHFSTKNFQNCQSAFVVYGHWNDSKQTNNLVATFPMAKGQINKMAQRQGTPRVGQVFLTRSKAAVLMGVRS